MGIQINRGQGSSGRSAAGFRFYSGSMFYGTAPSTSGWTTSTNPVTIKQRQILSAQAALDAGILPNTDNVAASGSILWGTGSSMGTLAAADVITITRDIAIVGGLTSTITLCAYTVLSGDVSDTTGATLATHIATAINALTYSTGFSATYVSGRTTTIIAPTHQGIYLNTKSVTIAITNSHTMTNTNNAFASGTASLFAAVYYHISEYYRLNPTGNLRVGFISASSSWKEILSLQIASGNQLRQIGVFDTSATNGLAANLLATVEAMQTTIATLNTPFEVVYQPNITAVSDLSTLPNGNLNTVGTNVQVIVSQDGLGQGNLLYQESGYSIGNLGANLGCLSKSRISASIAQPIQTFNISDGVENNTPGLANGTLVSSLSTSLYQQLFGTTASNVSGYCYVGTATYPGNVSGTFFSGNAMFTLQSSDYAFMNDNRVWDDVTRIMFDTYTPFLNSEMLLNPDGTIANISLVSLQNAGIAAITNSMITGVNPPYISGTPSVILDPTQKPKSTNVLLISVAVNENAIARNITITNGFA